MFLEIYLQACGNFIINARKVMDKIPELTNSEPCKTVLDGPLIFPWAIFLLVFYYGVFFPCLAIICVVPPSLPWILLYGFVIIPNEPYVKFCKDAAEVGVGHRVRAFLSNETETWECPPKPGSTWVKQSIHKDWQCNETYCTADELASPESCHSATVVFHRWYNGQTLRDCDNWSEDNPGCCLNADYEGTYVQCEYCTPELFWRSKAILWTISTLAGIATTIACGVFLDVAFDYANYKYREAKEKAKKEAEEKAKKDAEAAEHGV